MKRHNKTSISSGFFPNESFQNGEQSCNLNKLETNLKMRIELLLKSILFNNDNSKLSKHELRSFESKQNVNRNENSKRLKTIKRSTQLTATDANDEKDRLSLMLNIDFKNNHLNILDLSKNKKKVHKVSEFASDLSTSISDMCSKSSSFTSVSSSSNPSSNYTFSRDLYKLDKEPLKTKSSIYQESEMRANTPKTTPKLKRKFSTLTSRSKSSNCSFQTNEKSDSSSQTSHKIIPKQPISLVYYHHLYNERNKEFSNDQQSLQPLYKKVYNKLKNSYSFEKQENGESNRYKSDVNKLTDREPRGILKNKSNQQNEKSQWSEIAAKLQLSDQEFQTEPREIDENKKHCSKRLKQTHINKEFFKDDTTSFVKPNSPVNETKTTYPTTEQKITLNVKLLSKNKNNELNDFNKQASNIKITSEVLHENMPISHTLELNSDGSFHLTFNPKSFGYYHVSFFRNAKKIRDSTYIINFCNQEEKDIKCSRDRNKSENLNQISKVEFVLNTIYNQPHHIIGALCKFCPLNKNRIKDLKLEFESDKTKVNFFLINDLNEFSNKFILDDLNEVINNDKFVIIDFNQCKTIRGVKRSLKHEDATKDSGEDKQYDFYFF